MQRICLYNAHIIDAKNHLDFHGGLMIDHGIIADIGEHIRNANPSADRNIDCQSYILSAGLIDSRVTLGEQVGYHKLSPHHIKAASKGGITTMINVPSQSYKCDRPSQISSLDHHHHGEDGVRLYSYGAITQNLDGAHMAEMGLLKEAGALALSDGVNYIKRSDVMLRSLQYAASHGLRIIQHAEDSDLAGYGVAHQSELASRMGLQTIPKIAEVIAIERDLRLVAETNALYHVAHISTKAGIEAIRQAKAKGLNVTCDTAPPYFMLNHHHINHYRTHAKLSPPLRDEEDRQAVIEGLCDGTIDIIASDHIPQSADAKRQPFQSAAMGGSGLESLLSTSLSLYHNGYMTLMQLLSCLTHRPQEIYQLPRLGALEIGYNADLCLIDTETPYIFQQENMVGEAKNTPFDPYPLEGKVKMSICHGRIIYHERS
jgi:dihydroorotase